MTGFVLFFAVACLGGVIATVGDRIGMKVGKSRLSLFNLRPRQTATLVSVVTGMIASFATLTLLFLLDGSLRKGVFQLDDIQLALSEAQTDLEATEAEKEQAESTLAKSTKLQAQAQARLSETNKSLQTAIAREAETLTNLLDTQSQLDQVSEQAGSLRDEIGNLRSEREALIEEQAKVRSQIAQRDREITQRNAEIAQRNQQIAQRDQQLQQRTTDLSERDQQIAQRNTEIAERETRLKGLQKQQAFLTEEISRLEEEFQGLRLGNVAIARNQTLAYTVARPDSEQNAVQAVEQALAEANRFAVQTVLPRTDTVDNFTLRFDPLAVAEIVRSITDRQSYVIKVSSAANYVIGEPCVAEALSKSGPPCILVNVAAVPNEIIYQPGDVLASVSVSSEDILNERLVERFIILQATAEFEARRSGIIRYRPIIANGLPEPLNDFLTRVDAYGESIEIQAFASQPIYPTGPVYLELAAVKDGDVLFRTRAAASP
ncbi:MAG: DUF3084 domain-containing protein [Leptolyngbya foveolarum]|uniref:DUF3084 domain-containing protein n=1 Tax=Leptolyngbya foveolarum TaxID=47253 RepID=A0A2W4WLY8_9CYAN|nr:MAG: DUF3084 domain-containing protein [Leptolyngbya foveolarum]